MKSEIGVPCCHMAMHKIVYALAMQNWQSRWGTAWAGCVYSLISRLLLCCSSLGKCQRTIFALLAFCSRWGCVCASECAEEMKEQPVWVVVVAVVGIAVVDVAVVVGFRHSTRAETSCHRASHWSVAFNCRATATTMEQKRTVDIWHSMPTDKYDDKYTYGTSTFM